jgi:D-alanine-D-alanine ligase
MSGEHRPRVAVVYGGPSEERLVSIESGTAVARALESEGFPVARFVIDTSIDQHLADIKRSCDVVFVMLHGRYGEDGAVQQALEEARLAYTGSPPSASHTGMIKSRSKRLFEASRITTPKYTVIDRAHNVEPAEQLRSAGLSLPVVVKPDEGGSSIGVSIVREARDLVKALTASWEYDDAAIVEKFVKGRELTVGVLDGQPLPVIELISSREFFDYEAKYEDGLTRIVCPARLPVDSQKRVEEAAVAAFNTIGARDFGRTDIILDEDGVPQVLEVNTIPGFTSHSLLPHAAQAAGIPLGKLAGRIVNMAERRIVPD